MSDLVLMSGGLDSAVALARSVAAGTARLALSIDYGQRHRRRELDCARHLAARYGVSHLEVDLTGWGALLEGSSELVGRGERASAGAATVVPNRNAVLISVAGAVAMTRRCTAVVIAAHAGDHDVYPDCRPEFLDAAGRVLRLASGGLVDLDAPFSTYWPHDIIALGYDLGVSFVDTWSCYNDGTIHCGHCGACAKRQKAFAASSIEDPTSYEATCT